MTGRSFVLATYFYDPLLESLEALRSRKGYGDSRTWAAKRVRKFRRFLVTVALFPDKVKCVPKSVKRVLRVAADEHEEMYEDILDLLGLASLPRRIARGSERRLLRALERKACRRHRGILS